MLAYFRVGINLCLDLLRNYELCYLKFYALYCEVKSLGNLAHVNHFVRGDILNQGFATDLGNDLLEAPPKVEVILHLRCDMHNLPLEIHVSPIQEVLYHILSAWAPCHLHEVFEARCRQNLRFDLCTRHAIK